MLRKELTLLMHELIIVNRTIMEEADYSTFMSLCEQDITIISMIASSEQVTAKQISDILHVPKTTVVTAVDRLEKRGFIIRQVDEMDKRRKYLFLTDSGKEVNRQHLEYEEKYVSLIAALWNKEDQKKLAKILQRRRKR